MNGLKHILSILIVGIMSATASYAIADNTPNNAAEIISVPVAEMYSYHGGIEFRVNGNETCHFHVYSITGQMLKRLTLSDGAARVELPKGCYIVKCEKWSKKIVVS